MRKLVMSLLAVVCSFSFVMAQDAYQVGDKIDDFKLMNIDGKKVSLTKHDKNAKGYIVVFTCNHCPYAKLYEDRLVALDEKYAAKGYPVIAINPNDPVAYPEDSYENMKVRAEEKGFTFPYLFDETQEIAADFGATKTPHVFIVEKEGKKDFFLRYIGAIDDNPKEVENVEVRYVEDAVDMLLEGKELETTETKAIGCSIKWKTAAAE